MRELYNSAVNDGRATGGRRRNPLLMHPRDMADRSLRPGDEVRVTSGLGAVATVAEADATLLPGVVSLAHGYGPAREPSSAEVGASINALVANDVEFDPLSAGQPLMSNVPVRVDRR